MIALKNGDIEIQLEGKSVLVPRGTKLVDVLHDSAYTYVGAIVNNAVRDLNYVLLKDATVKFLDLTCLDGMRIYRNSLVFLLVRATREVLGDCRVFIKHSLSNGYYGEVEFHRPLVDGDIQAILEKMHAMVEEDVPFERRSVPIGDAISLFQRQGLSDKVRLLKQSRRSVVTVNNCGDYHDYLSSVTVPSTGFLKYFKLRFYLPGFILEFPKRDNPQVIPEYVEMGKLANVHFEAERWGRVTGISEAADLNDCIQEGRFGELVRISEAYHENQIASIAEEIARRRDRIRVILVAGPSSSGKTSFAQRLLVQLRVQGLFPVSVGLDDYFVDRDSTPKDEDGDYDFEALEAIDLPLFNEHLSKLIQGERVELPTYSFVDGHRKWMGHSLQVDRDHPIIIEGIHGLNPKLTALIPQGRKFKIYISALTNLNVDDHTRVPTTDVRMIRRMVRDNQFRSYSPLDTISRWPSVRRGEERNIFPFQEQADVMFNSALSYELAVLKKYAEPLLRTISHDSVAHSEAKRLLRFLSHFFAAEKGLEHIPCNSLIREFVGGSCFFR